MTLATGVTITRTCPDCGAPLVERTNRATGSNFLGCTQWPECSHTEKLPAEIIMRRAGARGLFDEDTTAAEGTP